MNLSFAQLLQNGSFENNYTDWIATGHQAIAANDPLHPASDGFKVVVFNPNDLITDALLSQTFVTIPGQRYGLSLDLGTVGAQADQRLGVTITGSGLLLDRVLTVAGLDADAFYVPQHLSFIANSPSTTLTFRDASFTYYVIDLLLDNIRVIPENAQAPLITSPPERFAAATGQSAAFSVTAVGAGTLSYQWRFSGSPIAGANGTSYTIASVDPSQAGNYDVVVSNAAGSTTSSAATLTVLPPGILLNGSFEHGSAAWTFAGAVATSTNINYGVTHGTQLVHFNFGQLSPNGVLSQTFATVVGKTYLLAFDVGTASFQSFDEQRMQVIAQGNSTLLSETISRFAQGTGTQYMPQTFAFIADSATTTLTFRDVSPATINLDLLLDNVRVTEPLQLTATSSRKAHGSAGHFDIDLPLVGEPGVECRAGLIVDEHTIVLTFNNALIQVDSVSASATSPGKPQPVSSSSSIGANPHQYIVELGGMPNAQYVTVILSGVQDEFGQVSAVISLTMGVLLGDVDGSGVVTVADTNLTKGQALKPVTDATFRMDVNASGNITTADTNLVKSKALTRLE